MTDLLKQPWPWYIAGPLIGLTVPLLLIIGNKTFGISSSLRHICASCFPAKIPFFQYNWKKESWNLMFVAGILAGGFITCQWLTNDAVVAVHEDLQQELAQYQITNYSSLVPVDLFNWENLFSLRSLVMMMGGGFLVGFGTRYAGGCTSGHTIMGLSNLQWPSLIATICFMVGGVLTANFFLPFILSL